MSRANDAMYMDADEQELLLRYHADNPSMLSFVPAEGRPHNVEECLVESELEQLVNQARGLMASRRAALSRESRIQHLPSHHTIPSVLELRAAREAVLDAFDPSVNGSSHCEFKNTAELLTKEVALAMERRNLPAEAVATLVDFYQSYGKQLAQKQLLVARRWFTLCAEEATVALQQQYVDRQRRLSDELTFVQEATQRLQTYASVAEASLYQAGVSTTETLHTSRLETMAAQGATVASLEEGDVRVYCAHHMFQQRVRRRFERFTVKARMVPQYKRYELVDRLVKHLMGGRPIDVSATSAEDADALPNMVTDDAALLSHLEELSANFKLPGFEKGDLHEFMYHLGKRYASTHTFQSGALRFEPLSVYIASKDTAEDPDALRKLAGAAGGDHTESAAVYLRPSPWSVPFFDTLFPRRRANWEIEQDTAMRTITTMTQRVSATATAAASNPAANSAGNPSTTDGLRVDPQLQTDFAFIAEEDMQVTLEHWRERAATHRSKAEYAMPATTFDLLVQQQRGMPGAADAEGAGGDLSEHDQLAVQRLQAVYQLRFLRTRQFRLHILKILNYMTSSLKDIFRDCKPSVGSVMSSATGVRADVAGLSHSGADARRQFAQAAMVYEDRRQRAGTDAEEYASKLLASLGLDPAGMSLDAVRQAVVRQGEEAKATTGTTSDPFWFSDRYEALDHGNGMQRSNVRDGTQHVLVMEEYALDELGRIEARLLATCAFFMNKHLEAVRVRQSRAQAAGAGGRPGAGTTAPQDTAIDSTMIVEDIYECELWFQQSKLGIFDSLREAYQHCTVGDERAAIAKRMVDLFCTVPRLDLSDQYFMPSYTQQVVVLDLESSLLREVIQVQVEEERKVLTHWHAALKSFDAPDAYAMRFGVPDASATDAALFKMIFPKTSVISVFDVYGSLASVSSVAAFVEGAVESLLTRYEALRCTAAVVFLQREVLQELLVQWRLLGDEERLARQVQHQQRLLSPRGGDEDEDADEQQHTQPALQGVRGVSATDTALQGGLYNILHVSAAVDAIAKDLQAAARTEPPPTAAEIVADLSSHTPMLVSTPTDMPVPGEKEAARSTKAPPPSQRVVLWFSAMEAIQLQANLFNALYETEIWCGVHRMQARLMGVQVRRTQLDPIDFDGRRAFTENDELDAGFQAALDGSAGSANIFTLAAQLALDEVITFQTEMLHNLSVCEFERSMGDFDLRSTDGVDQLLRSRLPDFRRAFYVQVANKNVFTAVTLCNAVALDGYIEGLYRNHAETMFAAAQLQHGNSTVDISGTGAASGAFEGSLRRDFSRSIVQVAGRTRMRLSSWPLLVKGETPDAVFIDRRQLQRLFISVNQVKSIHRKCALQEMSHRAALVLGTKKSDTVRKEIKALKESIVDDYCIQIMNAVYQYGTKFHICGLAQQLRATFCESGSGGHQSFFIFGAKNDIVKPVPRAPATQSEGRKTAHCMLSRSGKIDEPRYVPHYAQVIALQFEGDLPASVANATINTRPDHQHNQGQSHLRQNFLLESMASILHDWLALCRLSRGVAGTQMAAATLLLHPERCSDVWRSELFRMHSDIEQLRDPSDVTSVREYLHHRHVASYLCAVNACKSVVYQSNKINGCTSAAIFQDAVKRLEKDAATYSNRLVASPFASKHYFPRGEVLGLADRLAKTTTSAGRACPFYEPLRRVKGLRTIPFEDIDQAINEMETSLDPSTLQRGPYFSDLSANVTVGLALLGDEGRQTVRFVGPLYPSLGMECFLCAATEDERMAFFAAYGKACENVEDCAEGTQESLDRDAEFTTTFMTATISAFASNSTFTPAHYEVAIATARRDELRELYFLLLEQVSASVPAEIAQRSGFQQSLPAASASGAPLDELFQRSILQRARIAFEKESTDKGKKRGRGLEKELRVRQCRLLVLEIHKLLMARTCSEVTTVIALLESELKTHNKATVTTNTHNPAKTAIFTEFCSLLVAKAHCTRGDGEKVVVYHIPDHTLTLAMDTVAARIHAWQTQHVAALTNTTEAVCRQYAALVTASVGREKAADRALELSQKALPRRIQASVTATNFEILKLNNALMKENESLQARLAVSRDKAREEIRLEFEDVVTELQSKLKLRESQFASYKKKLFKDMQESLEDVKRTAMFSISAMEHAPTHVKRQALKIAISDDELNSLRDQNGELRQAITKIKLWYEIKLARMAAAHDKTLNELRAKADNTQQTYWGDRGISEAEVASLRRELTSTQVALTKSSLEVEVLRRDLQAQLASKKDLVAWRVQSGKQLEELQRRLRKFEKISSTYDIDKLVADYEKRLAGGGGAEMSVSTPGTPAPPSRILKGSALRSASSALGQSVGASAPRSSVVPLDEYQKLSERCDRERRLKEKAFSEVERMRQGTQDTNESLIWQRKYFEAASELQRRLAEVEALRAHIDVAAKA